MPVFVPPDFCFYTLFCFCWGEDSNALTPLWGSIFNVCQNCKWDLRVVPLRPTQGKHLSAVFIFNLLCVFQSEFVCVCVCVVIPRCLKRDLVWVKIPSLPAFSLRKLQGAL